MIECVLLYQYFSSFAAGKVERKIQELYKRMQKPGLKFAQKNLTSEINKMFSYPMGAFLQGCRFSSLQNKMPRQWRKRTKSVAICVVSNLELHKEKLLIY